MTDVLNATKVTKRFGGLVAVHDIDFAIPEGSIVSLIGPNGAGKTTFFNIIAGIYDPTAGSIDFHGENMIARSRRAWLEPFLWLTPPGILALITLVISGTGNQGLTGLGIALTVLTLLGSMVTGVARPPAYQRFLRRFGIFRSARPERHGRRRPRAERSRTSACSPT